MNRVTLTVDGMMCGMCENHVCEALRGACDDRKAKVSASHRDGRAEIIMDGAVDAARLKAAVKATGYRVTGISVEPYEKKSFSLLRHGK